MAARLEFASLPLTSNCISMNFPKREELSFRVVHALPKASSSGLDSSTLTSTERSSCNAPSAEWPPMKARYFMMSLAVSVLPAPDSPEMRMDCDATRSSVRM